MGIADWPEDQKPREKLLTRGAATPDRPGAAGDHPAHGREGKERRRSRPRLDRALRWAARAAAGRPDEIQKTSGLGTAKTATVLAVLALVKRSLSEEMRRRDNLSSPNAVRDYLRLNLAARDREVFVAVFLDAQNRVLKLEELFAGTLTQTSVFPREVVRFALQHNAAAVIFAHNHPSGLAEPSRADEVLTHALKQALALVDVKVLDHFIVGGSSAMSFAERGLL